MSHCRLVFVLLSSAINGSSVSRPIFTKYKGHLSYPFTAAPFGSSPIGKHFGTAKYLPSLANPTPFPPSRQKGAPTN